MRALFAISHVLSPSTSRQARLLLQRTAPFVGHQVNAVSLGLPPHRSDLSNRRSLHGLLVKIFHQHNIRRRVIHLRISQPLSVWRNT